MFLGGTLDVTAHEIIAGNKVREIDRASGGDFGGIKVDAAFEKMLSRIFGEALIQKFKAEHSADWLDMINQFEVRKRSERIDEEGIAIRLASNFINFYKSFGDGDSCSSAVGRVYKPEEVKIIRSDYLSIGPSIMEELFKPVIRGIIDHLKSQLRNPKMSRVSLMFLVGGFAESHLLQSRIKEEFGKTYKILIPNEAKTAVLRGAVMFGKDPNAIVERVLAETYGVRTAHDFSCGPGHLSSMEMINGKPKCLNYFSVVARVNEVIKVDESKKSIPFQPVRPDQTSIGFDFYTSTNPDAIHVTDDGVKRLPGRTLTVASPDTSKGTDRKVELNLYFGGTEIKVTAVDLETHNAETAFIDFLATDNLEFV